MSPVIDGGLYKLNFLFDLAPADAATTWLYALLLLLNTRPATSIVYLLQPPDTQHPPPTKTLFHALSLIHI